MAREFPYDDYKAAIESESGIRAAGMEATVLAVEGDEKLHARVEAHRAVRLAADGGGLLFVHFHFYRFYRLHNTAV